MIHFCAIHTCPDTGYDERFDTLMMPNATIAVLRALSRQFGIPGLVFDESYLGKRYEKKKRESLLFLLRDWIDRVLIAGDEPVLYATVLYYNALGTLEVMKTLKQEYGAHLRTGVGGQLVSICPNAFLTGIYSPYIDQVAVGDAEVCLKAMLVDGERFVTGSKKVTTQNHYTAPDYSDFFALGERLDEMAQYELGPFTNVRMLCVESVRGCSWAWANEVCSFCALQDVGSKPVFRDFKEYVGIENHLRDTYGVNWLFDVSNQFIPVQGPTKQVEWLKCLVEARKQYGGTVYKYGYLTTNSITRETAPLLYEGGFRMAYVGIDGWNRETLTALGKTHASVASMFDAARRNSISIRSSLVVGSGLTSKNVDLLPKFAERLMSEYGDVLLSLGIFIEILLPGSRDWSEFRIRAFDVSRPIFEAQAIFREFDAVGGLPLPLQERLNVLRIETLYPSVPYEQITEAVAKAISIVSQSKNTTPTTIRSGGKHLERRGQE